MKTWATFGLLAATALLGACATTSNVTPSYVSPSKYQALDCQQIQNEFHRIGDYLAGGVKGSGGGLSGIGIGLGGWGGSGGGWGVMPSISINMGQLGSGSKRSEIARLLGEQEALAQAAKFKNCPVELTPANKKAK
ncbi:MAG: hypothetical protein Q4D05_01150 [Acinetobacter sp.]|nr:hypothetical protein [Acinetobacter sp.]